MSSLNGSFIISLDFELYWGIHDTKLNDTSIPRLIDTRKIINDLLDMFNRYEVHATFATVGFLFSKDKDEISSYSPKSLPNYSNPHYSAYPKLKQVAFPQEDASPYHAPTLIGTIASNDLMELGTHTFSHFYALEDGVSVEDFKHDLTAAIEVGKKQGYTMESIVFPRNQYSDQHLVVCKELGIKTYRGNEDSWVYQSEAWSKESIFKKGVRFLDSYFNLTGQHCYSIENSTETLTNIPASKFLRPYSAKLSFLEGLKLRRIKKAMTHAAKNKLAYHLWWHPHNFSTHTLKNFQNLEKVLRHYHKLNAEYGFQSITMGEAGKAIRN